MKRITVSAMLALTACGQDLAVSFSGDVREITVAVRAPIIGKGDHSVTSVTFKEIAGPAAGLKNPRDLAFNPLRPDELWVVNEGDDSVVIITDASQETRTSERRKDGYALHFMAHPSSIAFGAEATTIGKPGTFGTCQESRNTYGGQAAANDFMGPALWSSDLSVFAMSNPYGLGAHLDMLHGSPNCMGIAHEKDNVYWVFGGKVQTGLSAASQAPMPAIVRYDFELDHGIGRDDHSDGRIQQFADNLVKDVAGVPSHLVYDAATKRLLIADTGNGRIAALDTQSGTPAGNLRSQEPVGLYQRMDGAVVTDVVPAGPDLVRPSGLELEGEFLFVSDHANGRISAFTQQGERVNWLETGLTESVSGMAFGPDHKLYIVDMKGNRVLRIDVP